MAALKKKIHNILEKIFKKVDFRIFLSIVFAIPALFLWFASFVSIIYINFLSPWIYSLEGWSEFFWFLFLPFCGLFFALISWRKTGKKSAKLAFFANALLIIFVILGSIYYMSGL